VPEWISENLTALYVGRYGFATGGGPRRRISRSTLVRLLVDPVAACDDIRRSRAPSAVRLAREIEASAAALAVRRNVSTAGEVWADWEAAARRSRQTLDEWIQTVLGRSTRRPSKRRR
jgi:hypothetical protein